MAKQPPQPEQDLGDAQAEPLQRAAFERLAPMELMDALISRPDARDAVHQIAPLSLYHLIREIGVEDAVELAQLASPQQIQAFVDLDCWRRDAFLDAPLIEWLQLVLRTEDDDLKQTLRGIDLEPLAIMMRDRTMLFVADEDNQPPEELQLIDAPGETLDGVYFLVYKDQTDEANHTIRFMLRRLYDLDRDLAWTLLETMRWELRAPMEENAYQSRRVRLESLGFYEVTEALEIYAALDASKLKDRLDQAPRPQMPTHPPEGLLLLPDLFREPLERDSFLKRALARLTHRIDEGLEEDTDPDTWTFALIALTHKAMAADAVEMRDLESCRRTYARVLGTLTLALELISGRDLDTAASLLARTHPVELFRAGYTATARLALSARRLLGNEAAAARLSLIDDAPYSLLNTEEKLLVDSLLDPRPTYHDPDKAFSEPFSSLADLERSALRLSRLAFKITALFGLASDLDHSAIAQIAFAPGTLPPVEAIDLDTLLTTLVARRALACDGATLRPLDPGELAALVRGPLKDALASGSPHPDSNPLVAAALSTLSNEQIDPAASPLARSLALTITARLTDELAHLDPDEIISGDILPEHLGNLLLLTARG